MLFFAHHLELHHLPVLAALFVAGCWSGWHAAQGLIPWRSPNRA